MKRPTMILFDYGQTLLDESYFDALKGTQAVLDCCVDNPHGISAEQVQGLANEINQEMDRFNPATAHLCRYEIHEHQFQKYLYEYHNITPKVTPVELETTFWEAANSAVHTKNIVDFLEYLKQSGIRTGVISNMGFSGQALENRINKFFPSHAFEFIIATSEYIFRKPHRRIYEIALKKAKLEAGEVWYCGDNGICDVDGASNVGIAPVWYKGAIHKNPIVPRAECIQINDWNELKLILERL